MWSQNYVVKTKELIQIHGAPKSEQTKQDVYEERITPKEQESQFIISLEILKPEGQ